MHPVDETSRHAYPTGHYGHPVSPAPQEYGPQEYRMPRPPKKRRTGMLVLTGIIVLITLGIGGAFAYAKTMHGQQTAAPSSPAARQPANVACEHGRLPNGACAGGARTYSNPAAKDFELNIKTTKKECFDSAGCLITFEVELNYLSSGAEPGTSWDITYDITGAKDPYTNTLTTTFDPDGLHGTYAHETDEMVQTKSSSVKLAASITAVNEA